MKNRIVLITALSFIAALSAIAQPGDYPIQPAPFTSVHLTDNFWAPRIRMNHDVTIPIAIGKCYETGRVNNFMFAAGIKKGEFCTEYPFDDSDVYKILEGASYSISMYPDAALEKTMDSLIYYIGKAQEPDGYLYTNRTINPQHLHPWVGKERWEKDPELSHELYNLGHLYEAAVAHYQATGKHTLLDIAIKSANLVYSDFIGKQLPYYPGHQVVEMGLVKLYRVTQDQRYLDLAKYFLDIRKGGEEYNQANKPVTEQDKIVGHAVRATYMYSGMADVAAIKGVRAYTAALDKIWDDLIGTKYYITGGIGSSGSNEGFGEPYELPNMSAYCETCASIGLVYWNYRMFLLTGDSKYYDILERTLYNGLLSGVSLSGDHFFYPNVLESRGQHNRSPWFGCACCPSNICRFMPSVPGYVYARDASNIYVNLFIQNDAEVEINGNKVQLTQVTNYPWDGNIAITVNPAQAGTFGLALRIPGWARGEAVPGNLYHYLPDENRPYTIQVNGHAAKYMLQNGYAIIQNNWKAGDRVDLNLPMPAREISANPLVAADRNRVSLQRGPLVYCIEWPDNKEGHVLDLVLDPETPLTAEFNTHLLNGVETVSGNAKVAVSSESGNQLTGDQHFTAIPYYAWANRGAGNMEVWIPTKAEAARPIPVPTFATQSKVSGSTRTSALTSVNDLELPSNSNDHSILYFHWWPKTDTTEWIQYDFKEKIKVSECSVYWFDDGPWGGCRIPAAWRILYKSGNQWIPVKTTESYSITKDRLNTIRFKPVATTALRLEVTLQKEYSSGVYEWGVK